MTTFGEWGWGEWGSTPYGGALGGGAAPTITPLHPLDGSIGMSQTEPITIRVTDDVSVSRGTISVVVGGQNWVLGGTAVNGAGVNITPNTANGFDLILTPPPGTPYVYGSRVEVLVVARDNDGNVSSLIFSFYVGVGLRLLKATNPFDNVILAYFNKPLAVNTALFIPTHWVITPISVGAKPLTITDVTTQSGRSDVVRLRYEGGGSIYELTAVNVFALDGSGIEHGYDSAQFEIFFGDQDAPTVRLFNSIWGPLGISQRTRTRRTVDDHVAGRSLALALDEQFRIRMQTLDGSAGRDGRPGTRRT